MASVIRMNESTVMSPIARKLILLIQKVYHGKLVWIGTIEIDVTIEPCRHYAT